MTETKEATFMILINHASAPIGKERVRPTSKAKEGASRNKFVEKSRVPDGAKSLREGDRSKNRARVRPGFVIPIRNGQRKKQNLI